MSQGKANKFKAVSTPLKFQFYYKINHSDIVRCTYCTFGLFYLYEPYTKFILKFRNKYDII